MDDFLFINLLKFHKETAETNTLTALISRRKDVVSPQSGIGGNDITVEKDNSATNDDDSNNESALTSIPDYIESSPKRLTCNHTERVLYPGQIAYSSGSLPEISTKAPESGQSSSSANFLSLYMAKSHKHIVRVLRMFSSNMDNEGADEPTSLKEPMAWHDWPEWKIAIERKYNSLIENST